MRWLFLFVFSLNLAYIALEMSGSSDDYAAVPALKNVQAIVLLSELKQSQVDLVQVADGAEATTIDVDSAPAETALVTSEQAEIKPAQTEPADSEQVVTKLQEIAEKKPKVISMPAGQASAKNTVAKKVVSAKRGRLAESLPVQSSQSASCFTLGPFRDLGKLRGLTRDIKSYVVEADFRGREEKEQTLYWVYVKPEKNRVEAIKTGKRLKTKKIKDFYVIRDGEKINGLSLGHFRNKKGAYGLAKKVKNFGFDVMVEPVFRVYTIYWLDYKLASGVTIPESVFDKYTRSAKNKKGKISRLSRDCGV